MRQQQVASTEGAPFSAPRKVSIRNSRREESADDEKLGDCLKLGNRRVLVKMPGNKVKVTTASQQAKHSNDRAHKAPEVTQVCVDEQSQKEEVVEQAQKRSVSDGVSLPQWGQRKRLRFNNRVDVKPAVEATTADKKAEAKIGTKADIKAISRVVRGAVKAEKSAGVLVARIKGAVAPKSSALKLATGNVKRDTQWAGATCTARNSNNHIPISLECEANTARTTELLSDQPVVNLETASIAPAESLATQSALSARTDDNVHHDKTTAPEKVDMDLFQWPKFLVSLSRKEKEDDFFAIKGSKLPVRPKKRSKFLEKTVTSISPGAWLCDITRERYEVKEKKAIKKKPRGLKAMGSADSDTD